MVVVDAWSRVSSGIMGHARIRADAGNGGHAIWLLRVVVVLMLMMLVNMRLGLYGQRRYARKVVVVACSLGGGDLWL